jgi:S1-C subfamily serine protease
MKILRPFTWAAVLVAAFLYITSVAEWDAGRVLNPMRNAGRAWTEPTSAATAGVFTADEQNNIEIYRTAKEATVNITSIVVHEDFFYGAYQGEGAGSGFIINPDGRILTNYHVVKGSSQLTVTLNDKKTYKARVLGVDRRNDLALIKLIDPVGKLPSLPLGDSEKLVVGQKAIAIGNPFGQFGGTLTVGVVSALDRTIKTEDGGALEGMVQTDAAINPGNSGGPLLDSHGNVIAINTAIYGPQGNIGLGFALPINRAKAMLDEFTKTGRITTPFLGVSALPISPDLAQALGLPAQMGLLVQGVERGSPAEEFGIKGPNRRVIVGNYPIAIGGDFIVAIDGKPIDEGTQSLATAMGRKRGGDMMDLTLYRNGRREQLKVKLGSRAQQL